MVAVGAFVASAASSQVAPARQAIVDGEPSFELAVVALLTADDRAYCSGSLVAPGLVLTAAHCLDHGVPTAVRVGDRTIAVRGHRIHPDYDARSLHADLAILRIPDRETPSLSLRHEPLDAGWLGRPVRVIGFGATSGVELTTDGRQRARTTTIERIEETRLRHGPSSCDGDSGGAVVDEATGVLVGVISSGPRGCVHYGRATRVDVYLDWIAGESLHDGCSTSGSGMARRRALLVTLFATMGWLARRRRWFDTPVARPRRASPTCGRRV